LCTAFRWASSRACTSMSVSHVERAPSSAAASPAAPEPQPSLHTREEEA
jgi:hypothetical protein